MNPFLRHGSCSLFAGFRFPLRGLCLPPRVLFFFLIFLCGLPASGLTVTTQEVEEALTCQCGCGLTVHSCNHLQCGFAIPAKKTIADLVAQGEGKEAIAASFVARYGEKVLSAPTTTGFNLAAWLTPFLAVLVGGVSIGVIGVRWRRRQQPAASGQQAASALPNPYQERLKKELESFEG